MYQAKRTHKLLSLLLAVAMIFSLLPVFGASAADVSSDNVIFFATDRHESTSNLKSLLQALAYTPGLVVLGGDHVNDQNSGSLASITSEIQSVYPGVQTFYTYAAHDTNVSADSSNPYAYARTGEVYEGADYYVYGVDQNDMQSSSSASTASANFKTWAATADSSKVIFVMCHMPIHSRRGDNAGGATWMTALNEVGESHDIVYLWGHNHTGENSTDTSVYFVARGGSITPQGGSTGTINFTYMNAGYIKNGYASMVVVNSDTVSVSRYSTSGSVTASYTIERQFAESHVWEATETVEATCETDGYTTYVCSECGETKTSTIAATGHSYTTEVITGCTGTFTRYTCTVCADTYTEQMANSVTYDSVSSLVEGESYVIVASNYALTGGSSITRTSVTVSSGSITSDVADTIIWTYTNGMLYNEAAGGYLYVSSSSSGSSNRPGSSSSSRTLSISSTGSTVSYSSNKLKVGSYYLYHSSSSGFSGRSNGSTVTLYKVNETIVETGDHTYEVTAQSAATCENDGYITYTCTGCGDSYTEVISATGSHAYTTETVDATCESAGSVTYTCTVCGDSYMETIPALGHSYEAVVTAPTCTEAGYTTYTCACGDSYVADEVAALGHTYTAETVNATCTEAGSVTYTCACGDSYVETIAALGHSYEAVVTAPTCTEVGYTTYTCACGDSFIADEVAALGHEVETVTVEATCVSGGYTAETCIHCGEYTITAETEALGHSYEAVTTAPTCTEDGHTTYTCACGDSYVADEITALGHDYQTVTVDATCENDGSVTTTCAVCGDTSVEVIAALGHSYEAVTTAPTCTEDGYTTCSCTVCGHATTEVIAAIGHNYETVTVDATCENDGSVTTTCAVCGDTHTEVITALGHNYSSVTVDATCVNGGYTTHTCENCGDSYVSDEIAALGHSYNSVTVDATCVNGGYTTHTCENCGSSYVSDQTAALGHNYNSVTVDATCTAGGYTTHTCENCGDSYVSDQTAALGHSYSCAESDGYLVYTCDHCGDSYSEEIETGHSYTQVSSISAGSNYVITLYSGSKYYALSHAGNTISVTEVTVSNGQITSEITEDLVWNYNGSTLSYEADGTTYYLYASRSGGFFSSYKLSLSTTSSSTVSFSSNKIKVGSRYLRYSNGSISMSSFGASTAYAFIEE